MARMIPQRLITDASHWQTGDVRVVFDIESDFLVPWFQKAKLLWKYNTDTEKGTYHEGTAQWTRIKWAQLCNQPRGRNRTGPVPTAPSGHSLQGPALLTSRWWNPADVFCWLFNILRFGRIYTEIWQHCTPSSLWQLWLGLNDSYPFMWCTCCATGPRSHHSHPGCTWRASLCSPL